MFVIVKPETFIRWHRTAFRMSWRWKSRKRGRPAGPNNVRRLIREMHHENPTWSEERIANELSVKLGIQVSPRTVRKDLGGGGRRSQASKQRWSAFVKNQASALAACDFFISITATFRVLYVFVAMEIGSRRIVHYNVTSDGGLSHPAVSGIPGFRSHHGNEYLTRHRRMMERQAGRLRRAPKARSQMI